MSPIRVLLVDDHAILREGIRYLLSASGEVEVIGEAQDGVEALEMVEKLRPDAVLMDIAMPRMNGIEATKELKKRHPDLPVLILSMYDSEEYVLPILRAGAAGYVLKRAAAQELVSALKAVTSGQVILHPDVARTVMDNLQAQESPQGPPVAPRGASEAQAQLAQLTEREREVLTLIAHGLTNQQIAERLFISIKTVQAHRANLMEKLDLHDAVELTKFAIKSGLLPLDEI
ncbi:response regulator [Symbiobacterium thermophilum]|uniref:Stage 0 sporulation protein A homolog n=2 Tax=Symbiobacterium thermophilum TaxID=2734 RepID=Q67QY7_SYMTH|nr:response regulator transcription factor [Symbiobacterium thermophilum]MBY6274998.1 DNA-binding response regulator [Symbiobacterium thermophilum]BAD39906.1 two-component response regulator [Symbiobacterium thermophilum IAM 14863]